MEILTPPLPQWEVKTSHLGPHYYGLCISEVPSASNQPGESQWSPCHFILYHSPSQTSFFYFPTIPYINAPKNLLSIHILPLNCIFPFLAPSPSINILPFILEYIILYKFWNSPGQNTCSKPSWISHTNRITKWLIICAEKSQMHHPWIILEQMQVILK